MTAKNIFVSPNGESSNSGLSIELAINSVTEALAKSSAGDTIFLMPGVYPGKYIFQKKSGSPDQPIVIRSLAAHPRKFAIIDAASNPQDPNGSCIVLKNCAWINIENIVFKNGWPSVIDIFDSEYISIRSCHFHTGKRVIQPQGHGSHHILVENCFVKHPDEVWDTWSWVDIHHGEYSHYNGGLLHPARSGGGHVMRGNMIINMFNGFRTRPVQISEDGNIEVYSNTMVNIRDNDFEPEGWAWNIHYYYNRHYNIHKVYSIDHVKGGRIYIYGNTYTQSKDDWALKEVSGIYKYKMGPITYPCYAFNNSYYTAANVLRRPESTNHLLKHFNNAYYFFEGDERFQLINWQPGYEFDYDCINHDWPPNIYKHKQERHGLKATDAEFIDATFGNFKLSESSPCIDAGKTIELSEFDWTQDFDGDGTDIGAFEGVDQVDGPPFRFIPSPEGAFYEERPRISRHKIEGSRLKLFFSAPLDSVKNSYSSIEIFAAGVPQRIENAKLEKGGFELNVQLIDNLKKNDISIQFGSKPRGVSGLPMTYWASTIPIGRMPDKVPNLSLLEEMEASDYIFDILATPQLIIYPDPSEDLQRIQVEIPLQQSIDDHVLSILDLRGDEVAKIGPSQLFKTRLHFELKNSMLDQGTYLAYVQIEGNNYANRIFIHH